MRRTFYRRGNNPQQGVEKIHGIEYGAAGVALGHLGNGKPQRFNSNYYCQSP